MIIRPSRREKLLQPNGLAFDSDEPKPKFHIAQNLDHIDDLVRVMHESEVSRVALDTLTSSPEFQAAAMRHDHDKSIEILIILPGDTQSEILREAARRVEHVIFGSKDGESRQDLDHHYASLEDRTVYILPISRRDGFATPLGMMRLVHGGAGALPSVDNMAGPPWHQDPVEMMTSTMIPRSDIDNPDPTNPLHMMSMPDLRTYPGALDIVAAGTLPEFRRPAATDGIPVALAMYNATCRGVSMPAEIDLWATILDKLAHRSIQASTGRPFSLYAQQERLPEDERLLKQLPYYAVYDLTKKKYSNYSRPDYSDVVTGWVARLMRDEPETFASVWGDGLDDRVAFTTLGSMDTFKGDWKSEKWDRIKRSVGQVALLLPARAVVATDETRQVARAAHTKEVTKRHFITKEESQAIRRYFTEQVEAIVSGAETVEFTFGEKRFEGAQGLFMHESEAVVMQVVRQIHINDHGEKSYSYQVNAITAQNVAQGYFNTIDVSELNTFHIDDVIDFSLLLEKTHFRQDWSEDMARAMEEDNAFPADFHKSESRPATKVGRGFKTQLQYHIASSALARIIKSPSAMSRS